MAVGESPAVARHRLRVTLREARERRGLTQRQVARSLEWSLSKVNRIEAGEVTISSTDLKALLGLLGITDPDAVQQLLDEGRAARRRGWWDQPDYREHLTPAMIQAMQFETDASTVRSFQPTLIPGLLQTHAYASAIVDFWADDIAETDRAVRVDFRNRRREHLLTRPDPPEYLLVLDESVLLREVGGPAVMSEQLYDLLDVVATRRVLVRIVPLRHVAVYVTGMFIIYADSEDEDVALYRESHLSDEVVYSPESIRRHRLLFERAWEHSLPADASIRRIEASAAAFRSAVDRNDPDG